MKKLAKNVTGILEKRDRGTGMSLKSILKIFPITAVAICMIALLTKWIGFAAGFAATFIPAMIGIAGYCIYMGE